MVILQKGLGISGYRDRFGLAIPAQGKQHVVGRDMYIHPLCFLRMLHVLCFFLSLYYIYMLLYVSIIPSYLPISFLCQVQTMSSNLSSLSSTSEHDNLTIVPDDSASQVGEKECHLSAKVFHSLQQRFVAHFLFLFLDVSVIWPRSQALHPGIMGRTNGHSSCFVVHCCVQVAAWPRKRQSDWWEHTGWAKSCLACSD